MFADDDELRYQGTRGSLDATLTLDSAYRLAHLPLVNPAHPDVISRQDGTDYEMGRYDQERISLVAPVPVRHLDSSAAFNSALAALRGSPLAGKIAWDVYEQRKYRLHLTICSRLESKHSPREIDAIAASVARHQAFRVRLGGPWIGAKNHGRVYLPAYPERREKGDALRLVQRSLNLPETRLYVVGLWNFTDHLNPAETEFLEHFITRFGETTICEFLVEELHLEATHDDLVLSGQTRNAIKLKPVL